MFDYEQRPNTPEYRDNWDKAFGKEEKSLDAKSASKIIYDGLHFKWEEDEDTGA